jgi:hypothetical protein
VEVDGVVKETKLIVEPKDELFITMKTPDNSLSFTIQAFERIKFGERKITLVVPMDPKIVKLAARDKSVDAVSIELLTGEWWEKEFEYLAHVEAKAKISNGIYRKLMGGLCPAGFRASFLTPDSRSLIAGSGRTGSCHAIATANIASRILEKKGLLKADEVIHPSFWSLHYWTDMKGANTESILEHEFKKIDQLVADINSGRVTKDPNKLRNLIRLQVIDEQAGLPRRNIELMNNISQIPVIRRQDITKESYSEIINLTNSLTDLRANIVLDSINSRAISRESIEIFFEYIDKIKQNLIKSHGRILNDKQLASVEVVFKNTRLARNKFYNSLEEGPLIANFNGHVIKVLKKTENKITIFDTSDMPEGVFDDSIDSSVFFKNLHSYFIITSAN